MFLIPIRRQAHKATMMQKNNKLFTLPNVKTAVKVSSESLHTHPHPTFAIRFPVLFNTRIYFLTSCFRS